MEKGNALNFGVSKNRFFSYKKGSYLKSEGSIEIPIENLVVKNPGTRSIYLSTNLYASLSFCECRQCLSNWEVQTCQMAPCQNRWDYGALLKLVSLRFMPELYIVHKVQIKISSLR